MLSERLNDFILNKCRTFGTNGIFIGPDWVKAAIQKDSEDFLREFDNHDRSCDGCGDDWATDDESPIWFCRNCEDYAAEFVMNGGIDNPSVEAGRGKSPAPLT